MIKRALISVSDKTGVVDLAKGLSELGVEIISTGGTSKVLKEAGVEVLNISDITGFPECLDGRSKHFIQMSTGNMAMRSNPEHMKQIRDWVLSLLIYGSYQSLSFQRDDIKEGVTLEEAIENIDIGGPTMIRAAAKNYQDVVVVVDPDDYG